MNFVDGPVPTKSPLMSDKDVIDVIEGHKVCQTKNGVWLCLRDIYEKFHRPNIYDIGGTYNDNVPDFWFTYKIERTHGMCLLHLFAGNYAEGTHLIGVSSGSLYYHDKDQGIRMSGDIEIFHLDCKEHNHSYITTYSFKDADVEDIFKNKTLYIAVQLTDIKEDADEDDKDDEEAILRNHDFEELLKNPVGSDFIIESEDGIEFPVHRNILSVHSEVFKAMLSKDMVESRNGRVKLVDVTSEDLRIILEYIYTCTIKDIEEVNLPNIIMLADRYNIVGLQELCDCIMIDQLAPDTALDILVLADRFSYSKVKNRALQYIKRHKDQFKNAKFDQVDNMSLMRDICTVCLA